MESTKVNDKSLVTKDIKGSVAGQEKALHAVLRSWIRTNILIAEEWGGKYAPWYYNERASLSVLAGAIWRCGGIAFEEFSEKKLYAGKPYPGRCDIYFKIHSKEFVAEAKHGWSRASTERDPKPRIKKLLEHAVNDARALNSRGQCRLAVVFIAPCFTAKFKGKETERINNWIENIRGIDSFAKAWVFPKASRRFKGSDGYYSPGAAVFVHNKVRRTAHT